MIDTQTLPVHKKKVRPLSKQGEYESRNLWRHVTNALRLNDISTATEHKSLVCKNFSLAVIILCLSKHSYCW